MGDDFKASKAVVGYWLDETAKLGGKPNPAKCKVFYNDAALKQDAEDLAELFKFQLIGPEEGFMAAGTPIGSPDYVTKQLETLVQRNERMFDQLEKMDPQCANLLLRQTTLPRMSYLMRTCSPTELSPHLADFDARVTGCFSKFAGLDPAEVASCRARSFSSWRPGSSSVGAVLCCCQPGILDALSPRRLRSLPRRQIILRQGQGHGFGSD